MSAMETMMSRILVQATGMTPEQLQGMAMTANGAMVEAVELLREIKTGLADLNTRMEALENAAGK